MRKLTPEEREKLQAMLDKQDVEKAEGRSRLRFLVVRRHSSHTTIRGAGSEDREPIVQPMGRKEEELIDEGQKRRKRTGSGPRLKQMKLTEEEKRKLAAKIRGTS